MRSCSNSSTLNKNVNKGSQWLKPGVFDFPITVEKYFNSEIFDHANEELEKDFSDFYGTENVSIPYEKCDYSLCSSNITILPNSSVDEIDKNVRNLINTDSQEGPFYVMDLGHLVRLYKAWREYLPRVEPFYAVKCNPQKQLISTLYRLGAGFDCASRFEISQVLETGVSSERIIFANPCKLPSHIHYASSVGVNLMTFDSEDEILKVKALNPRAKLLVRFRADDAGARCPLGVKYGALKNEVIRLLYVAKLSNMDVVGVAFHVGSGSTDPMAFTEAIYAAKTIFDSAKDFGFVMNVLDIGGGFSATAFDGDLFFRTAKNIDKALETWFPQNENVRVIAEPGRYFAEAPYTLATSVYGCRNRADCREYWINDGIYGSMNCVLHDHAILSVRPLFKNRVNDAEDSQRSTIFGPTCDSLDTVMTDVFLPKLSIGDWLVFPNMGAYTLSAGSNFNGFLNDRIHTFYVYSLHSAAEKLTADPNDLGNESQSDSDETTNSEGSIILD